MESKRKKLALNYLGVFFLFIGVIAVIKSLYRNSPSQILYACYIGIVLIGIGILTRKNFIILSQIYVLTIPLLIWDIDFIHWVIFNKPLWGITDYFFFELSATLDKFITLQHLYTIPISIYVVKLIGVKSRGAWKWSIVQLTILFIAVTIFSPRRLNVNCVFDSCISINLGLPYNLAWFLGSFGMVGITALTLNFFLWPKNK